MSGEAKAAAVADALSAAAPGTGREEPGRRGARPPGHAVVAGPRGGGQAARTTRLATPAAGRRAATDHLAEVDLLHHGV